MRSAVEISMLLKPVPERLRALFGRFDLTDTEGLVMGRRGGASREAGVGWFSALRVLLLRTRSRSDGYGSGG